MQTVLKQVQVISREGERKVTRKEVREKRKAELQGLYEELRKTYNLGKVETDQIKNSQVANTFEAYVLTAGCKRPLHVAMALMAIYVTAHKNAAFDQLPKESFQERMDSIRPYGGNKKVFSALKLVLEIYSIEDHYRDKEADRKSGKFNPILAEDADYEAIMEGCQIELRELEEQSQKVRKFLNYVRVMQGKKPDSPIEPDGLWV